MPKKKEKDPNQGDLFERVTTNEECRKSGGTSWKADSKLGRKDGKNLGWCKYKQSWLINEEGDDDNA